MTFFRPNIERLAGYVPGEQPQSSGWVKLNTNENPYPPSPRVQEAIINAAGSRLNLYPDPLGTKFRMAAAEQFQVDPDWILPGNGSDEVLTILTRSFIDPSDRIAYPYPSYILYETLADLQGAAVDRLLLNEDWTWNLDRAMPILARSKLHFLPNPNSPSGTLWPHQDIVQLVPPHGLLILDEAYGDFPAVPHRAEILRTAAGRRIIITRTFSKSYSLAGIRFGFAIAHPDVISGLRKVKDSYNCDAISIAAATAAIQDQHWMLTNAERIRTTRTRMADSLTELGFRVLPSDANFVWSQHQRHSHRELYEALKSRQILVRYMRYPDVPWAANGLLEGLRISVGTDEEIDLLLAALREIV